jgi:mono/diheme cytochrome c family protein
MTCRALALLTLFLSASLVGASASPGPPHDNQKASRPSVLDGVYTTDQARRGQQQFEQHCASCHRADLGGLRAPALKGDRFIDQWREFPVAVLFNAMQSGMPLGNPSTLPTTTYIDISAYLLEANGLPPGRADLTPEIADQVLFVGLGGPKPLPTSAPAVVAGCMTKDPGNGWFLTNASAPARTLNPYEFASGEVRTASQMPPDGEVFRLQNLEDLPGSTGAADRLVGFKVVAKGILVRHEKGARLNVAVVNGLGEACEQ